jgi:hypothetical protein
MSKPVGQLPVEIQAVFQDGETVKLGIAYVDLIAREHNPGRTYEVAANFDELRKTITSLFEAQRKKNYD